MFRTTRKLAIVLTSAAALVALASPAAFAADTGDGLTPAATSFTVANNGNVTLSGNVTVGFITVKVVVTCTSVTLTAKTPPASPPSLTAPVTSNQPVTFTGCTDNQGGRDTVTTSGSWSLTLIDNPTEVDPVTEPNTGDQLTINIPAGGAKFSSSALSGCTITANASSPKTSSFNDGSGSGGSSTSGTFSGASVSVTGSGSCSASATSLSGIFQSATAIHDTT
jgi:hypothetical protein